MDVTSYHHWQPEIVTVGSIVGVWVELLEETVVVDVLETSEDILASIFAQRTFIYADTPTKFCKELSNPLFVEKLNTVFAFNIVKAYSNVPNFKFCLLSL